ncbi:DcaP family trimeric outer membrane transporter [Odoribacter lunatus]|uniref:DcaP family trimeric outer membrane transporter n=1 Tax=Odoribacter lunatus TaxID=2941335 RepID=UPI00203EC4A1|nr:DcaP family trimeric outer membrane transporter [Odoribacter lunatus]
MKKYTFLFLLFLGCLSLSGEAQKINVVSVSEENDLHNFYTMMKEAFPLAFNDPTSPRFIFFDTDKRFIFGIGGYVQVAGVYDFNGVESYDNFTTSTIAPKGHQKGSSYGISVGQSRLFLKLLGDTKLGRVVSYIELELDGPNNNPVLNQAFIQLKGFTFGKTWSTFCDMTAVPTTIDQEGPSSAVAVRQPQIRYTYPLDSNWQAMLALEYAVPDYTNQTNGYTESIRQRIPDIPLAIRYTAPNKSHLQAAAILRNLYYKNNITDKDKRVTGWGVNLSGNVKVTPATKFLFQGVYGKGLANYIQDISSLGYDLVPQPTNGRLKASAMWGMFAAIQKNWMRNLYSSLIYSYARMENIGTMPADNYKYAQYAAVNLLWNFSEYGSTGVEYVFGRRNNFNQTYGNANRINVMVKYSF